MANESELVARRRAIQKLIQPQLDAIANACAEVEERVGIIPCIEREAAIQLVAVEVLRAVHNIPCGVIGWCEAGQRVSFSAVSYAHDLFLVSDSDLFLSTCMKNLTDRIAVEQFELVELVQNRRAQLAEEFKK